MSYLRKRSGTRAGVWTAAARRAPCRQVHARHGFGYQPLSHVAHAIGLELLQYVPVEDSVKISRMTLPCQPLEGSIGSWP